MTDIFKDIRTQINEHTDNLPVDSKYISDETLEVAAKMYLYIMAPAQDYWLNWYNKYSEWLDRCTLKRLLGKFLYYVISLDVR